MKSSGSVSSESAHEGYVQRGTRLSLCRQPNLAVYESSGGMGSKALRVMRNRGGLQGAARSQERPLVQLPSEEQWKPQDCGGHRGKLRLGIMKRVQTQKTPAFEMPVPGRTSKPQSGACASCVLQRTGVGKRLRPPRRQYPNCRHWTLTDLNCWECSFALFRL